MSVKRNLAKVKETSIEAELIRRVEALGGVATKTQAIGCRGFFDRVIALPGGRIIFAELKRPKGGKVSPHQYALHRTYKLLGAQVEIISNREDIDRLLKE